MSVTPELVTAICIGIGTLLTTLTTLILTILNRNKTEKIHALVNSGRTELLREILGIRIATAKLSGKESDALLAEQALKNLEDSNKANTEAKGG